MLCDVCKGNRRVLAKDSRPSIFSWPMYYPCPTCHGFGVIHCCEGDQIQPSLPAEPQCQLTTEDQQIAIPSPTSARV